MAKKLLYPVEWDSTAKEKQNGWRNSPRILSEIVTAMNEEYFITDENEKMEEVDILLDFIKQKYFSGSAKV